MGTVTEKRSESEERERGRKNFNLDSELHMTAKRVKKCDIVRLVIRSRRVEFARFQELIPALELGGEGGA